jgi:hypothetical protein
MWNEAKDRVAIAWNVSRGAVAHGYALVAGPRSLAAIDLLDAGVGAAAEDVVQKLSAAGFRVAHRGKAQKARATTAIYFNPGHEASAREVAKALGAQGDAVQPATWRTPWAITVAAAPP